MNVYGGHFDPIERAREKQISRDYDDARLRKNEHIREQMRKENGFFSVLNISDAKIVRRRRFSKST